MSGFWARYICKVYATACICLVSGPDIYVKHMQLHVYSMSGFWARYICKVNKSRTYVLYTAASAPAINVRPSEGTDFPIIFTFIE